MCKLWIGCKSAAYGRIENLIGSVLDEKYLINLNRWSWRRKKNLQIDVHCILSRFEAIFQIIINAIEGWRYSMGTKADNNNTFYVPMPTLKDDKRKENGTMCSLSKWMPAISYKWYWGGLFRYKIIT